MNRGGRPSRVGGHVARRRFGQNFLVATDVVARIVDAVQPQPGDTVVEIGPGLGALTGRFLERAGRLHVVEIDRDLAERLRTRFAPDQLVVHEGDALEFDFAALKSDRPLKIVGNLPYNISTPLLFHLARFADDVAEMHFMLQKEVVDRMVAEPGGKDYGRLSVMLQVRFRMERLFVVPPDAFDPAPKIDSAVVRMIPFSATSGAGTVGPRDPELFARLVTAAFAQRRKMLRNTLAGLADAQALAACGIPPTARAEEVPVAAYVRLADLVRRS